METIDGKIHIEAPVGDVYTFVTDPKNWPSFVARLGEIRSISSPSMEPGTTFVWEYAAKDTLLSGTGHVNQNVLNAKFSMSMEGSAEITESYTFTPVGDGTDLSVRVSAARTGGSTAADTMAHEILGRVKTLCEQTRH